MFIIYTTLKGQLIKFCMVRTFLLHSVRTTAVCVITIIITVLLLLVYLYSEILQVDSRELGC